MAKRGRPAKTEYQDLTTDFQDAVASMSDEDVRKRIAEVALDQAALNEAQALDEDLKTKKEEAKFAGEIYAEGNKANKLKIKYCRSILLNRGKAAGTAPGEE